MDKRISLKFVLWSCFFSAIPWGILLALNLDSTGWCLPLMLLGCLGPAAASFLVTKKHGIVTGFSHWLATGLNPKLPLLSWLLPLGLFAVFAVTLLCFGIFPGKNWPLSLILAFAVFGPGELGWRHVLQPLTSLRLSFFLSVCTTACAWMLWSLPMAFMEKSWLFSASIVMFAVLYIGLSFVLGSIRRITRATLPCALCASLTGSWIISGAPKMAAPGDKTLIAFSAAVFLAAAAGFILVLIDKKRPFLPPNPVPRESRAKPRKKSK